MGRLKPNSVLQYTRLLIKGQWGPIAEQGKKGIPYGKTFHDG
jgi:hypothetical protein